MKDINENQKKGEILAKKKIKTMKNVIIHREYMEYVKKFDMEVLFVIVETNDEKLYKFRFDPNMEQFYYNDKFLGYVPVTLE